MLGFDSCVEIRGLIRKEWDPETWNEDICMDEPVLAYLEPQISLHPLGWQKQLLYPHQRQSSSACLDIPPKTSPEADPQK